MKNGNHDCDISGCSSIAHYPKPNKKEDNQSIDDLIDKLEKDGGSPKLPEAIHELGKMINKEVRNEPTAEKSYCSACGAELPSMDTSDGCVICPICHKKED